MSMLNLATKEVTELETTDGTVVDVAQLCNACVAVLLQIEIDLSNPKEDNVSKFKPYGCAQTGQITEPNDVASTLAVHETLDGKLPLCGIRPRPWKGIPLVFKAQGPGKVDCVLCGRKHQ